MAYRIDQVDLIIRDLNKGKIGVLPTDTIYGIHCVEKDQKAIERVYKAKNRPQDTPYITLIGDINDLERYGFKTDENTNRILRGYWPGPNTFVFETEAGKKSFRIPNNEFLLKIIKKTGALLSTSANPHGEPPSKEISEAIKYFGEKVDFYVNGGKQNGTPSAVYRIKNSEITRLR